MEELANLKSDEQKALLAVVRRLQGLVTEVLNPDDFQKIRHILLRTVEADALRRDQFGLNPILFDLQTAVITAEEIGLNRASIVSILLHDCVSMGVVSIEEVEREFGEDVAHIIRGIPEGMKMFQHPLGRFDEYRGIIWNSRINFVSLPQNK